MADGQKELLANIAPFGLRLQPELKERIKEAAELHGRSMNAEIVSTLEEHPRLVTLPMEVSYLKMENARLTAELLDVKSRLIEQQEAAANLHYLLPDAMREQLRLSAQANGQSMNAEIIARLEATLSDRLFEGHSVSQRPLTPELFDDMLGVHKITTALEALQAEVQRANEARSKVTLTDEEAEEIWRRMQERAKSEEDSE